MQESKLIIVATFNKHKLDEMNAIVQSFSKDVGIRLKGASDFVSSFPEEDGTSFDQNALIKARYIKKQFPTMAVIADDSGLEVKSLGGRPGIRSSRYSVEGTTQANNKKLLEEMKDITDRTARFCCSLAYIDERGEEFIYHGYCSGVILESPCGQGGFGYDPLFFIPTLGKTLSEISMEEKNKISHRSCALYSWLKDLAQLK